MSGSDQHEFVIRDLTEDHMISELEKDDEAYGLQTADFHDNEILSRGLQKLKE